MTETLSWWLIIQVAGLAVFPFTLAVFKRLPDGGYAFSKVIGLLAFGYLYWIGGTLGALPNERWALLGLLAALVVAGAVAGHLGRDALIGLARSRWRAFVAVDVLFAVALAASAFLRSYVPEIDGTEKPMDFAFINAVLRADTFPAEDPWLAGHDISYYYFGHILVAAMTSVSGVAPAVGYNLGVALVAALAATACFGVVWNLVAAAGRTWAAYAFGLGGVGLLLLVANWEGLFELLAIHGLLPGFVYGLVDIGGLEGPRDSESWYPTEFWFWWRASRIVSNWTIREFPFFSFLLGDLHAHVMALPMFATAIGFAFTLLRAGIALDWRFWALSPVSLVVGALLIGAFTFLNAWDFPTALALVGIVAVVTNIRAGLRPGVALLNTLAFVAPLALLSLLLFMPYLGTATSAAQFVAPVLVINSPDYVIAGDMATRPLHLLIAWGPLFWLTGLFLVFALRELPPARGQWVVAALPLPAILGAWAGAALFDAGPEGLADEVSTRGEAWLSPLIVGALLVAAGAALIRASGDWLAERSSLLLALAAGWLALLLILGAEFFYIEEFSSARLNTVFKLSFQAWTLLAVSSAFGAFYAWQRLRYACSSRQPRIQAAPSIVAGLTAVVLAAALVYPVTAIANRTDGLSGPRTLDGLAFVRESQPDEYATVAWLSDNVGGNPTVLEASGPDWGDNARISWRTGLPTVIGWPSHEFTWRGTWDPQEGRSEAVDRIYTSNDPAEALELLHRYGVEYVVAGRPEVAKYGEGVFARLDSILERVADLNTTVIYRVPPNGDLVGAAIN
ncbi:MAG: hypothetical protein GEU28_08090 [Dehalococcoidia bacterium]|nr:hypothetical protein [Dehalococcoidia bacterium]